MRRLAFSALCGGIAGAAAGVADAVFAFSRGPVLAELLLVAAGLFASIGAALGVLMGIVIAALSGPWRPIWRGAPPRRGGGRLETLAAILVVATLAGVVLVGMGRAQMDSAATMPRAVAFFSVFATGVASVAAVQPLARLLGRDRRAPALLSGAVVLAAILCAPWFLRAAETVDLRPAVVALLAVSAFAALFIVQRPRTPAVRALFGLGLVALAVVAPLRLVERGALRLLAARYAPATGTAARWVARVADFDGDGYSPLSGEGDCAPWDPRVHPFAFDIPGNGRDEDCHAGDLDPAVFARRDAGPPPVADTRHRPNILLVTIDTLRADRLGAYGYGRQTTPTLDAFAEDAVVFERAYSSSPVTDRALPTLLGGLYPSMYTEAVDYEEHKLASRRELLAERLRAGGYYTATISTTYIVRRDRLQQGLQHVDLRSVHDVRAEPVTDRVVAFLDRAYAAPPRTKPLFLWVHYYDPHGPYEAPPEHRLWDEGGASTAENRSDRYDAEVHYVDAQLARVFAALRRHGAWDDTLVVITADHGEEFLEHGGWYHAEELYDESVRVPLLVRLPGGGGRRVKEPVGLVDVMPTALELVHLPPPRGIEGRSQAAAVRGEGGVDAHPIILEQWKHKTDEVEKIGVVDGPHKLVLDLRNQLWELYDLSSDPAEAVDRYGEDPQLTTRLRAHLLDYWAMVRAARQLDPEDGAF